MHFYPLLFQAILYGITKVCVCIFTGEPGVLVGKIEPQNPLRSFNGYADSKESNKKVIYDVFAHGDQGFNSGKLT
jgi:solute carrier family 27 fatty acid transporter 1/4